MSSKDPHLHTYPTLMRSSDPGGQLTPLPSSPGGLPSGSLTPGGAPSPAPVIGPSGQVMAADGSVASLGGYSITGLLGEGGMGRVYRAYDEHLARPVALKTLLPEHALTEEMKQRFLREARAAARLNHPNIVQVYAAGVDGNTPFFVMELIEGASLKDLLETQGPFALEKALDFIIQAVQGLKVAATHNLVHRDIKPGNLVLDSAGTLKVADFGLVKQLDADMTLTRSGITVGSPCYMSPEQADAENLTFRSDIYSLGATLFHLLVGEPPFNALTPLGLMMKHAHEPVPDPEQLSGLLNGSVSSLIGTMMAKKPEDRFDSYDELLGELYRLKGLCSVPSIATRSAATAKKTTGGERPDRARLYAGIALGVGVVLLAVVAFLLMRDSRPPQTVAVLDVRKPAPAPAAGETGAPRGDPAIVLPAVSLPEVTLPLPKLPDEPPPFLRPPGTVSQPPAPTPAPTPAAPVDGTIVVVTPLPAGLIADSDLVAQMSHRPAHVPIVPALSTAFPLPPDVADRLEVDFATYNFTGAAANLRHIALQPGLGELEALASIIDPMLGFFRRVCGDIITMSSAQSPFNVTWQGRILRVTRADVRDVVFQMPQGFTPAEVTVAWKELNPTLLCSVLISGTLGRMNPPERAFFTIFSELYGLEIPDSYRAYEPSYARTVAAATRWENLRNFFPGPDDGGGPDGTQGGPQGMPGMQGGRRGSGPPSQAPGKRPPMPGQGRSGGG